MEEAQIEVKGSIRQRSGRRECIRNERCKMKPGRKLSKEFRIKIGVTQLARDWHLYSFYDF